MCPPLLPSAGEARSCVCVCEREREREREREKGMERQRMLTNGDAKRISPNANAY